MSTTPNPQPGGLGYLSGTSLETCPATVALSAARLSRHSFRVHWCMHVPLFKLSHQQIYYRSSRYQNGVWGGRFTTQIPCCRGSTYTIDHTRYSMLNCFFSVSSYLKDNKSSLYTRSYLIFDARLFLQPHLLPQREHKLPLQLIARDIRYSAVSSASARTSKRTQAPSTIVILDIRCSTVFSVSARNSQRSMS